MDGDGEDDDRMLSESEIDEIEWLDMTVAAAEVDALAAAAPKSPPPAGDPLTQWRTDRCPATPPPDKMPAVVTFVTATELTRRRWQRLRATPVGFEDVPEELYPDILAHVPIHSLSRLCLVSSSWTRAVLAGLRTQSLWMCLLEECEEYKRTPMRPRGYSRSGETSW
eukprot:6471500-Prymnesium_polylepis.1